MKKFIIICSVLSVACSIIAAVLEESQVKRLKNQLADANLAVDLAKAKLTDWETGPKHATSALLVSGHGNDQLREQVIHADQVIAVNEKQGAHTMIYVPRDSYVDLATGEIVFAGRDIPKAKDEAPNAQYLERWQKGGVILDTPLSFPY